MKIVELGCGNLDNISSLKGDIIAVDKKIVGKPRKNMKVVEGDFFDITFKERFDRINAHYSLCFNKKGVIESKFPYITSRLKKGGVLSIKDFQTDESIVLKRTNLDDSWFFDLLKKYVNPNFKIKRSKVFEESHNHTHLIFELIITKT